MLNEKEMLRRAGHLRIKPKGGDTFEAIKRGAQELIKKLDGDAKIYFSFNAVEYVCDSDGNVAKK